MRDYFLQVFERLRWTVAHGGAQAGRGERAVYPHDVGRGVQRQAEPVAEQGDVRDVRRAVLVETVDGAVTLGAQRGDVVPELPPCSRRGARLAQKVGPPSAYGSEGEVDGQPGRGLFVQACSRVAVIELPVQLYESFVFEAVATV
jgi:hypothetical protein